ncbi:FAD-dependent oxidoreductase [Haliangium ochraceum]|uniref:Tryptophan 2-monooxygenase n=1 Tax=Haliangium ochraceum (strain DSM 14365 / JCM 11303 / SMP-2) TaxID=502025 RepID=D0LP57_HALO1|nr:FAD-dependent oxidoreductase [Haliangium ochraceum]ACY13422.1 amine oxidase [Haliangium ochraceum DSM 14365]
MSGASGWNALRDLLAKSSRKREPYDVVIVGAGLAGLRAAVELREHRVLVLERSARAGGRVRTAQHDSLHYDLGAALAYEPGALPFAFSPSPMVRADSPLGCAFGERVVFGSSVRACLDALELEPGERELLRQFEASPADFDPSALPLRLLQLANAFFQDIHFGAFQHYVPARYGDVFTRFQVVRRLRGNGELTEALERRLEGRIEYGAEVTAVEYRNDSVAISYTRGGERCAVDAKAVIVATPGSSARQMFSEIDEPCRSFLDSLRYTSGIVVALGVEAEVADFSYLVTADHSASVVLNYAAVDGARVLLLYYPSEQFEAMAGRSDQDLAASSLEILASLNIGIRADSPVRFSDVQRWPEIGVVIAGDSYDAWDPSCLRPGPRVFLAGDYTFVEPDALMPYGMHSAMASGIRAAHDVTQLFAQESDNTSFRAEFLTFVTIYEFLAERPIIRWKTQEGNIAFYGLLLEANPGDVALRDYLRSCSVRGLWEYQPEFGVTPEDSALVMNGLLAAGVPTSELEDSAERFVELFFDSATGSFLSLSRQREGELWMAQGRAEYWQGPSIEASAMVGYLLHCIAPERFCEQLDACRDYLAQRQQARGFWQGRWFPSEVVDTFYVTRLLATQAQRYEEPLKRARAYLYKHQRDDGSWFGSVIDTAAAMRALAALGEPRNERGREWLEKAGESGRWRGEPVLYYAFDGDRGQRLFYHCADKGKITTAWATLALAL